MKKRILPLVIIGMISIVLVTATTSLASPSQSFSKEGNHIFDDWDICRTRAYGEDGFFQIVTEGQFRPVIAFESLGNNMDIAYSLGQQFEDEYPDRVQRAEAIFYYVRDHVQYTPDIDQFRSDEFAQNADELAATLDEQGFGRGDCEDSAVLLAIMYKGAGFRSAIIHPPGHAATAVYLPEYGKAEFLELDGEPGWLWAEATGKNNPFGWIPQQYSGGLLSAYEIDDEPITGGGAPSLPASAVDQTSGSVPILAAPFIVVVLLMFILPIFRLMRKRR